MEKSNKLTNKDHSPEKSYHRTGEKCEPSAKTVKTENMTSVKSKGARKADIIILGRDGKTAIKDKKD